jgi:hypothetical protein
MASFSQSASASSPGTQVRSQFISSLCALKTGSMLQVVGGGGGCRQGCGPDPVKGGGG